VNRYGIYPSVERAAFERADADIEAVVEELLGPASGGALTPALVELEGRTGLVEDLASRLSRPRDDVEPALEQALERRRPEGELVLTGAEVVALLLREAGVRRVFAYAGTSELALCDRIARTPGVELVNGRGDKESAFMAGGASLLTAGAGAAVIHAARGLTNAAGAVADLRRNEVATTLIVGLPSTGSAPYLPPHGEHGLLRGIGSFAKAWHEVGAPPEDDADRRSAAVEFVRVVREALDVAKARPFGPTLVGIPQDVAETAWIPWSALERREPARAAAVSEAGEVAAALAEAERPLLFVDDYFLRYPDARRRLRALGVLTAAPILQLRYTRGAMLFERLSAADVPSFVGWYDRGNPQHARLMLETDLLITLEDRNLYPRVVGELPRCRKVAITSDASKARKNGYLGDDDVLAVGDVGAIIDEVVAALRGGAEHEPWAEPAPDGDETPISAAAAALRSVVAGALADVLEDASQPVVVDDSQMLGGLLADEYERFPSRLRVFGSHGGFVGCGIAYATGLALAEPGCTAVCTLGDQGFTNGLQGLAAAGQEGAPVTFVVGNNGGSVSLHKQSSSDDARSFDSGTHRYLRNAANLDYVELARSFGIRATSLRCDPLDERRLETIATALRDELRRAVLERTPSLIELELPPLGEAWDGIWATAGNEQAALQAVVG
jgi:acetolactate synthase-1/2/3 large subunit